MNKELRQRLKWIELYEESNNAVLLYSRCEIPKLSLWK